MRNEKCANCYELFDNGFEGYVCEQTKQPIFMMQNCPMEDLHVKCDLDPCFVWFPNGRFAETYCRTVAYGKPCQFHVSGYCQCGYYSGKVRDMRYCPLPRFDIYTGRKLKPMKNHDIVRMPDYILRGKE